MMIDISHSPFCRVQIDVLFPITLPIIKNRYFPCPNSSKENNIQLNMKKRVAKKIEISPKLLLEFKRRKP